MDLNVFVFFCEEFRKEIHGIHGITPLAGLSVSDVVSSNGETLENDFPENVNSLWRDSVISFKVLLAGVRDINVYLIENTVLMLLCETLTKVVKDSTLRTDELSFPNFCLALLQSLFSDKV